MHLKAMEELATWLEDGAPHVIFDMHHGLISYLDLEYDDDIERASLQLDKPGVGDCGTVCCIAGYAAYLDGVREKDNLVYDAIADRALYALGLERDPHDAYLHPLFNPDLAPYDCTPQQAAVAVRRVMKGQRPWNYKSQETK